MLILWFASLKNSTLTQNNTRFNLQKSVDTRGRHWPPDFVIQFHAYCPNIHIFIIEGI
jgi:hypothetical protein